MSEKEDIPESTGISEASEDERKFILNTGEIVAYLVRARLAGEDPGKLAYGFHRALADEILGNLDEILGDDPDLTAMHIQLDLEQM